VEKKINRKVELPYGTGIRVCVHANLMPFSCVQHENT